MITMLELEASLREIQLADLRTVARPEVTREELEQQIERSIKEVAKIVVRGAVVGNSGGKNSLS